MSADSRDLHTRHVDALETIARSLAGIERALDTVPAWVLVVALFGFGWCR